MGVVLLSAGCLSKEAYMIGDELDHDMEPASRIEMSTVWAWQGSFGDGDIARISQKPNIITDSIQGFLEYL